MCWTKYLGDSVLESNVSRETQMIITWDYDHSVGLTF